MLRSAVNASRLAARASCRRISRGNMPNVWQARSFSASVPDAEKPWYMLGVEVTGQMGQLPEDLREDHEIQGFLKGIEAKLRGTTDDAILGDKSLGQKVTDVLAGRRSEREGPLREAQKKEAEAASLDLLAAAQAKEGAVTTASGLVIRTTEEGTGASATMENEVVVHYEGRLPDGKVFDSSIARGQPATFPVNNLIRGWSEGLTLMKVPNPALVFILPCRTAGGKAVMTIPSNLAYGHVGAGNVIPPHTAIEFDVEVIEVK